MEAGVKYGKECLCENSQKLIGAEHRQGSIFWPHDYFLCSHFEPTTTNQPSAQAKEHPLTKWHISSAENVFAILNNQPAHPLIGQLKLHAHCTCNERAFNEMRVRVHAQADTHASGDTLNMLIHTHKHISKTPIVKYCSYWRGCHFYCFHTRQQAWAFDHNHALLFWYQNGDRASRFVSVAKMINSAL